MQLPVIKTCLVCEDIRSEVGNKLSFMGVFGQFPTVDIVVDDLKKPITRLAFVLMTHGGNGKFNITSQLKKPNGELKDNKTQLVAEFATDKTAILVFVTNNFVAEVSGKFQFIVMADREKLFEDSFTIRQE